MRAASVSVVVIASSPPAPCRNFAMFGCARAGVIHLAGAPTTSNDGIRSFGGLVACRWRSA